jgi:sulfur carrier protein
MFSITLNGELRALPSAPGTVADLVRALSLQGKRIAVEKNGEIVPKSSHGVTPLSPGDKIEVVAAVGGG